MKKNPSNRRGPDPDDRRRRQKKPRPSREVQDHEAQENYRRYRRRMTGENLRRRIPDTLEEDIKNVQQPPPGVKNDSRLNPPNSGLADVFPRPRVKIDASRNRRNSGLAGMLNLLRYKP